MTSHNFLNYNNDQASIDNLDFNTSDSPWLDGEAEPWSVERAQIDDYEFNNIFSSPPPLSPPTVPRTEGVPTLRSNEPTFTGIGQDGPVRRFDDNPLLRHMIRRQNQSHGTSTARASGTQSTRSELRDPRTNSLGSITDHFYQSPPPFHLPSPSPTRVRNRERELQRSTSLSQYTIQAGPINSGSSSIDHQVEPAVEQSYIRMPPTSAAILRDRKRPQYSRNEPSSSTVKRRRLSSGASKAINIEEIDLSIEESSKEALLGKEQEELLNSQKSKGDDEKPKRFGQMNCIICLDNFTDLTATVCGHIFCHECLTQALIAGEKAADRQSGSCPMCRKPLSRTRKGHIIPLALKTKKTKRQALEA